MRTAGDDGVNSMEGINVGEIEMDRENLPPELDDAPVALRVRTGSVCVLPRERERTRSDQVS